MKVLFVNSGKPSIGVGRFIPDQIESLRKQGINVEQFIVNKKGLFGYLITSLQLFVFLRRHKFDIVHCHYSFTGYLAVLAGAKRIVTSLLGSDVNSNKFQKIVLKLFIKYFWASTIVKSENMKTLLGISNIIVIPNGVPLDVFFPINKIEAIKKTKLDGSFFNILFFSNPPDRVEKNLKLAREAASLLPSTYKLNVISEIPHKEVKFYMNAADLLLMTSLSEGSPNVIKEAMACNLPIVSVDVGDVRERIKHVTNSFIVNYNANEIAETILNKVNIKNRSNGLFHLKQQGLDSNKIASRIIAVYSSVLNN